MLRKTAPTWLPTASDYQQILREQNPWQETGSVPAVWSRYVERPLASFLAERLTRNDPRRFQLILGPRRVGKTTALYQTVSRLLQSGVARNRLWWLRLDHPLLMQVELGNLVRSVMALAKPTVEQPVLLFLDELTYAPAWDLWLKTFYDENWPIQIAGSSSATAAIRHRRLESGIGRWEEQYLAPYLFGEYLDLIGHKVQIPVAQDLAHTLEACIDTNLEMTGLANDRRRFLLTGGFPELLLRQNEDVDETSLLLQSQRTLRTDAVLNAIYKDIPQAFGGVSNPMMLERVLYTLAGQLTGILSPQHLCQGLDGLSRANFERYLTYLERAFLVFTLPNFSGNESSRQKRGKKLYFVDGAVRNAALQRGIAPLNDPIEMGLLTENLAAGHLHALSQQSQVRVYHWRDGTDEVDLVYDDGEFPLAFEIGSSASHHRSGLRAFIARFPRFQNRCYLVAPNALCRHPSQSDDGIGTLSLDLFLLAVSAQTNRELAARLRAPGADLATDRSQPSLFDGIGPSGFGPKT